MPHQCTTCGHTFPDGSKQMLSGCPDCGGNKFQFLPSESAEAAESAAESPAAADSTSGSAAPGPPEGSSDTASARDPHSDATSPVGSTSPPDATSPSSAPDPTNTRKHPAPAPDRDGPDAGIIDADADNADREDSAQASARRTLVSRDELPAVEHDSEAEPPAEDPPDIARLREELNQQFESIKIVEPGEYELNLMELYDREEYIVAIEEDGRYVIDVPSTDFD